jgi:hypothetical protein
MGSNLLRNLAATGGNAKGGTCLRTGFGRRKSLAGCGIMSRTGFAVPTA